MIADVELTTEHRLFLSRECALAQWTTSRCLLESYGFWCKLPGLPGHFSKGFPKENALDVVPEGNQPSRTSSHCSSTFTTWVIESFDGYKWLCLWLDLFTQSRFFPSFLLEWGWNKPLNNWKWNFKRKSKRTLKYRSCLLYTSPSPRDA